MWEASIATQVVNLSAEGDAAPVAAATSGVATTSGEKKASRQRGRVAWSWHDPTRDVWRSFSEAHARSLDIGWRLFQSGGRSDWVELTRDSDVFSVDLDLLLMRHVQTAAETRIRRVVSKPKKAGSDGGGGRSGVGVVGGGVKKKRRVEATREAPAHRITTGAGSCEAPAHRITTGAGSSGRSAPAPLVWRCTNPQCASRQAAATDSCLALATPAAMTEAAGAAAGASAQRREEPLAVTIEEKERRQRALLQDPRRRLIRRAGGGVHLGYLGPTNALRIDLDPEAGRFGSLRSLRGTLHLLRRDVDRGVVQLRPLIQLLAEHLARPAPHAVMAEEQDEDLADDFAASSHQRGRHAPSASQLSESSGGGGFLGPHWSVAASRTAQWAEEGAIRQSLFDTMMELLPLASVSGGQRDSVRSAQADDALGSAKRGLALAAAELSAHREQEDHEAAAGKAGDNTCGGGVLFFSFAVEQLWQHRDTFATPHATALIGDRQQMITQAVELVELVVESAVVSGTDSWYLERQIGRSQAELVLAPAEATVVHSVARLMELLASCDAGPADDRATGVALQTRLVPLAQALCAGFFVRGDRSSADATHIARWRPVQQLFVASLERCSPLLALLVMDLKLAPRAGGCGLWRRLAGWDHLAVHVLSHGAVKAERVAAEGLRESAMFWLASLYGAATAVASDGSVSSSPQWSVEQIKDAVAAPSQQQGPAMAAELSVPFDGEVSSDLMERCGPRWRRSTTGCRLRLAMDGLHMRFLHADALLTDEPSTLAEVLSKCEASECQGQDILANMNAQGFHTVSELLAAKLNEDDLATLGLTQMATRKRLLRELETMVTGRPMRVTDPRATEKATSVPFSQPSEPHQQHPVPVTAGAAGSSVTPPVPVQKQKLEKQQQAQQQQQQQQQQQAQQQEPREQQHWDPQETFKTHAAVMLAPMLPADGSLE